MSVGSMHGPIGGTGTAGAFTPADRGLVAWTTDPLLIQAGGQAPGTAGAMQFVRLRLAAPASVAAIRMHVTSGGVSLTSGQCFAALYTAAGALVAVTADQSGEWISTGMKSMALVGGPFDLAPGDYYVAFWFNGTTGPSWARATGTGATFANVGVTAPNLFAGTANTGLTTTAPATMGAQSTASTYYWAALD